MSDYKPPLRAISNMKPEDWNRFFSDEVWATGKIQSVGRSDVPDDNIRLLDGDNIQLRPYHAIQRQGEY